MKNKTIIRCMKCDFEGTEEDLVFELEDENDLESGFDGCPNCKIDSYLIDHNYERFEKIIIEKIDRIKNKNGK